MFKPGDIVVCVDDADCDLRYGKEYTVREGRTTQYVYLVERPGTTSGYGTRRFRIKSKHEFVKDFLRNTCK